MSLSELFTPADLEALAWQSQARCADATPDVFFPEKGGTADPAVQICHGCPVRIECLQYALDTNQRFGVWGGLTERQRRRLQRQHTSHDTERSTP